MAGVDRVVSLLRLCAGIIGPQVLDPGLPQLNKRQLHAGHKGWLQNTIPNAWQYSAMGERVVLMDNYSVGG